MKFQLLVCSIIYFFSVGNVNALPIKFIECFDVNPTSRFSAYLTTDNAVTDRYGDEGESGDSIAYCTGNMRRLEGVFASGSMHIVQMSEKSITLQELYNEEDPVRLILHRQDNHKYYSGFLTSWFDIKDHWTRVADRPMRCKVRFYHPQNP